jgi:hypothetical protein
MHVMEIYEIERFSTGGHGFSFPESLDLSKVFNHLDDTVMVVQPIECLYKTADGIAVRFVRQVHVLCLMEGGVEVPSCQKDLG